MLYTNLNHIESATDFSRIISQAQPGLIICGRMEPECIKIFRIAEMLSKKYNQVGFYDLEIDHPALQILEPFHEMDPLKQIPWAIYCKEGKITKTICGHQTAEDIHTQIREEFNIPK